MDKKWLLYLGLVLLGAWGAPYIHRIPVVGPALNKVPAA